MQPWLRKDKSVRIVKISLPAYFVPSKVRMKPLRERKLTPTRNTDAGAIARVTAAGENSELAFEYSLRYALD